MSTEMRLEQREAAVASWRRDQLVHVGLALRDARRLAGDPRYDLHSLLELVERGCSPELAMRILAPLDEARVA